MNDDTFDMLDGNDEFPMFNKVSKELFSVDLDKILLNEEDLFVSNGKSEDIMSKDTFDVDMFLYKNFRFISLNELNKELVKLNDELDNELLNLVNEDYNDFIKLGQSINNENFENLISTIKIAVFNYYKTLEKQQSKFEQIYKELNSDVLRKKRINMSLNMLEKLYTMSKLIKIFENKINNVGKDTEKNEKKNEDIFEIFNELNLEGNSANELTLTEIKDITSIYLAVDKLEKHLITSIEPQESEKQASAVDHNKLLEIQNKDIDIMSNIDRLNSLTLNDLLTVGSYAQDDLGENENSEQNPFADDEDEERQTLETELYSHSNIRIKNNKFLNEQLRKFNVLKLEFESVLDEHLKFVFRKEAKKKTGLVEKFDKMELSESKSTFLTLKTDYQVAELLGIYLILGRESVFFRITKDEIKNKRLGSKSD